MTRTVAVLALSLRVLIPIAGGADAAPGAYGSLWAIDALVHDSGGTRRLLFSDAGHADGRFVEIDSAAAADTTFAVRVHDLSRQTLTWGTTVPAVPASEFGRHVTLVDVPTDSRFRVMLRIYGLDAGGQRVRIRIAPLAGGDPLVDEIRELPPAAFASDPSFLRLALESWPAVAAAQSLRIEVIADDGKPLWAFAAITNNETQHVTVVSPQ